MAEKPAQFVAFITEHILSGLIGKPATDMLVGELSGLGGTEFQARIQSLIAAPVTDAQLVEASQKADECFRHEIIDKTLQGLIQQLPLSGMESLQQALRSLPTDYDDSAFINALSQVFNTTWPELDKGLLQKAVKAYLSCLRRALLQLPGVNTLVTNRAILRIDDRVDDLQSNQGELTAQVTQWTDALHSLTKQISKSDIALTDRFMADEPPVPLGIAAPRSHLAHQILDEITAKSWVYLRGAIGLGKTQLARMVFAQYERGRKIWIKIPRDGALSATAHIRRQFLLNILTISSDYTLDSLLDSDLQRLVAKALGPAALCSVDDLPLIETDADVYAYLAACRRELAG